MITVINSTNRPGNLSQIISKELLNEIKNKNVPVNFYSLEELPENFLINEMYGNRSDAFNRVIEEKIIPADKFVFVVPEYNGSYAGVLKLFLDAIHPKHFNNKKAMVVGVAAGRAGNLTGLNHLVTVLNYLQITTMPQKLIISRIEDLIKNRLLTDEVTRNEIKQFVERFIKF
jgi:NAD(P)H-dependent FMN reductase